MEPSNLIQTVNDPDFQSFYLWTVAVTKFSKPWMRRGSLVGRCTKGVLSINPGNLRLNSHSKRFRIVMYRN